MKLVIGRVGWGAAYLIGLSKKTGKYGKKEFRDRERDGRYQGGKK